MAERVAAVVVTYNRRELLQGCLRALRAQSVPPVAIVVVDNCSEDGTAELLAAESEKPGSPMCSVLPPHNLGGAGGFALGVEEALVLGPTWLWLLDDDTVPKPDALASLLEAARTLRGWAGEPARRRRTESAASPAPRLGFLASQVLWKDGTPHRMNGPGRISRRRHAPAPSGARSVDYASFVSLLVSREAVQACGLPIAEFFIGSDDVEYTWRITRAGFAGYHIPASEVWHLTPANVGVDVWKPTVSSGDLEKWVYRTRNLVAVNRRRRWGWFREGLRVILLPVAWRLRGVGQVERRRLSRAAREGLLWAYEPLIRYPRSSEEASDARPSNAA